MKVYVVLAYRTDTSKSSAILMCVFGLEHDAKVFCDGLNARQNDNHPYTYWYEEMEVM